jgi:hypothetical protein
MGRACSAYEKIRNADKIFIGELEGKRPLGKPWRRLEDNIKMNLREIDEPR